MVIEKKQLRGEVGSVLTIFKNIIRLIFSQYLIFTNIIGLIYSQYLKRKSLQVGAVGGGGKTGGGEEEEIFYLQLAQLLALTLLLSLL